MSRPPQHVNQVSQGCVTSHAEEVKVSVSLLGVALILVAYTEDPRVCMEPSTRLNESQPAVTYRGDLSHSDSPGTLPVSLSLSLSLSLLLAHSFSFVIERFPGYATIAHRVVQPLML